jgi:hypothetical protein
MQLSTLHLLVPAFLAAAVPTPASDVLSKIQAREANANAEVEPLYYIKNVKLKPRRSQSTTSNALDTVQRNEKRDLMLNLFTTLRGLDTNLRSVRLRHR